MTTAIAPNIIVPTVSTIAATTERPWNAECGTATFGAFGVVNTPASYEEDFA